MYIIMGTIIKNKKNYDFIKNVINNINMDDFYNEVLVQKLIISINK